MGLIDWILNLTCALLWLDELGATGDEIFDVALASTEAFANAVEHPREPHVRVIDVDGSLDGRTITVTVRDYGSWNHKWQRKEGEDGGYGLPLIRRLMGRVELDAQSEGTTIRMQRQLAGKPRAHGAATTSGTAGISR